MIKTYKGVAYDDEEFGVIIINGTPILKRYYGSSNKVVIPSFIEKIGSYSFSGNALIEEIELPRTLTSIGAYAFNGCRSLKIINFPDSITKIGERAFYNCVKLDKIELPEANTLRIENEAFQCCIALKSVVLAGNVEYIGRAAFYGCHSLEKVGIFSSWGMVISSYVFRNCEKLNKVLFPEYETIKYISPSAFEVKDNPLLVIYIDDRFAYDRKIVDYCDKSHINWEKLSDDENEFLGINRVVI